jgi:hypothetical protein
MICRKFVILCITSSGSKCAGGDTLRHPGYTARECKELVDMGNTLCRRNGEFKDQEKVPVSRRKSIRYNTRERFTMRCDDSVVDFNQCNTEW